MSILLTAELEIQERIPDEEMLVRIPELDMQIMEIEMEIIN